MGPWKRQGGQTGKDVLSQEIIDFVRYVDLTISQRKQRVAVVREVRTIVAQIWPSAAVEIFGSWQSGLCLSSSDIDLNVTNDIDTTQVPKLCEALEACGFTTRYLANAKVPVVKFENVSQGITGDIGFNMPYAAQSAELVKQLLRTYPAAKPLIIVLKALLRAANLNNVYLGGLSSYSITLMVVSFLQMHPYYKSKQHRDRYQLFDLLIDFSAFYGKDFNYHTTAISVLDGGKYVPKVPDWLDTDKPYLLSVIDPLDAGNDVARGSFAIGKVKTLLYSTYVRLQRAKQYTLRHPGHSALATILPYPLLVRCGIIPSINNDLPFSLHPQVPFLDNENDNEDEEGSEPVSDGTSGSPRSDDVRASECNELTARRK
eukprot:TRINITY_DN1525_c0_g1_i1.p1 TRINITY_DN1525_c0_g1~~TRINITY_DN1525_c0_g1_i1.p1  ORF type:complete len:382 (-),score=51.79 TRINITY_DN1525_c0_g1_i1:49-1167(-)